MQWLWIFYWLLILVLPLLIAVYSIRRKNYLYGIILIVLTIFVPLFHMYFVETSTWNGNKENEFVYLFKQVFSGNIGAIFITLGYIAVVVLCYMNIRKSKKNRY